MVIVTSEVDGLDLVAGGSPIELEVMNGAVITDAVLLEIVPRDDQKMVENGVLNGGAEVNEEKEVAAEGGEDNVVDDGEHENEGNEEKASAEEGGGDDVSDSYEDEDESDEEEEKVAAEEGGDGVYVDDEDEDEDGEEEVFVLNNEEVDDDGEEEEEGYAFMDEVENNSGWLEVDDAGEDKEGGSVGKESGKKEDEEKGGGNSEPKVRKLKKRIVKEVAKNVVENSSDEVIVVEKGKTEKDGEKAPVEEEKGKGNGKEEIGEKGKGVKKRLRLRKGDKKEGVIGSTVKVASEPTVKSDSKRKEKVGPKRVESMGMVFMCSSKIK